MDSLSPVKVTLLGMALVIAFFVGISVINNLNFSISLSHSNELSVPAAVDGDPAGLAQGLGRDHA